MSDWSYMSHSCYRGYCYSWSHVSYSCYGSHSVAPAQAPAFGLGTLVSL